MWGREMQNLRKQGNFLRDVWYLTKSYWQSEERIKAYWLLAIIVALTLGVVYVLVRLKKWNKGFYSALENYETEGRGDELMGLCYVAGADMEVGVDDVDVEEG